MADIFSTFMLCIYFGSALTLLVYGLNCYVMIGLFTRRRRAAASARRELLASAGDLRAAPDAPAVTTQIAIYNELNVVERVMRAVAAMHYAPGQHEIQVLDDSTDETCELVDRVALELRDAGHDVQVIRRSRREGFKAGALANGLARARGDLVAVFDADFAPGQDYLLKLVPHFIADAGIGLVQARWGHLNRRASLLTRAQSVGIDGHFMVEQSARNWNGLFMNFNGTAGMWRRQAIVDGGGWQWDTLTEDMDLSYRVQLAGWRTAYAPDVIVPAEIPEDIRAFKSQQFRWAKGSIQTALKILPLLRKADIPPFKRLQAFFHMTHYLVHPMMLTLAVLAAPVLLTLDLVLAPVVFACFATGLAVSMLAPSALYLVSQRAAYRDWRHRILTLPFLVVVGVGIALSNTRGVMEALAGKESPFVRTPKRGDKQLKRYAVHVPVLAWFEIGLGLYCAASFGLYVASEKYIVSPFLGIYATGFLFVGVLTILHSLRVGERRV